MSEQNNVESPKLPLDPESLEVQSLSMEDLDEVAGGNVVGDSYTCPESYTCPQSYKCPPSYTCPATS